MTRKLCLDKEQDGVVKSSGPRIRLFGVDILDAIPTNCVALANGLAFGF